MIAQFVKSVSPLGVRADSVCPELPSKKLFALRYNRLYAALPTFTHFQHGGGIAEFLKTNRREIITRCPQLSQPPD